ncbi:response regulator [Streptomyces sp. NPDC052040]
MTIRVLIAGGQAIFRAGLRMMIESQKDLVVVGEAADGAEAIARAKLHEPDVALVDLELPNLNGICTTRRLVGLPRPPGVILLSDSTETSDVCEALEAGASGFLLKDVQCGELCTALPVVASGARIFTSEVLRSLVRHSTRRAPIPITRIGTRIAALSEGERNVLRLIGTGMTNDQIAKELHLARTSVKTYVSRILTKLGLDNRTQAAVAAYSLSLTTSTDTAL